MRCSSTLRVLFIRWGCEGKPKKKKMRVTSEFTLVRVDTATISVMGPKSKTKRTKPRDTKIINLSEVAIPLSDNFEVKDYDYNDLQQPDDAFEKDLNFLLQKQDELSSVETPLAFVTIGDSGKDLNTEVAAQTKKRGKVPKFKVVDVTRDIEDLKFSSSEDDSSEVKRENALNKAKKKRNHKAKKKKQASETPPPPPPSPPSEAPPTSTARNNPLNGTSIVKSAEESAETTDVPKPKSKKPRKKSRKTTQAAKSASPVASIDQIDTVTLEQVIEDENVNTAELKGDISSGAKYIDNGEPIETKSDQTILIGKDKELITVEELKKRKVVDQEYSIFDAEANLSRNQRRSLHMDKQLESPIASNPFAINLRPTKTNLSSEKFPDYVNEVRPIKTIIGLSHKQILHLSLTDVKIKAIVVSSSRFKFIENILRFTLKHSHDMFSDDEVRSQFITLCVNVALYEAHGFKKTSKLFPVMSVFGLYPEITLEATNTKVTPPEDSAHQNSFDYSVLAFIGHIIIWGYSLQASAGVPTLAEKYSELQLSSQIIRSSIGGDHLWDKLSKSVCTGNLKRWKHVLKYREAFAFYEDQFMLILRFMNVDSSIP